MIEYSKKWIHRRISIVSFLIIVVFFGVSLKSKAQPDSWVQKSDLCYSSSNVPEPTARHHAIGFSIGTKGFIGLGYTGGLFFKKDLWEYDAELNVWTQKADFGGTARHSSVGFSIGNKGYVGTGAGLIYEKDFWEYDPSSNTWTKKADFGGLARTNAVGFNIGTKGYIGIGKGTSYYKDFWEYDPSTNTWTQKTDFGGTVRSYAVGFCIANKGYIGTGSYIGFQGDVSHYKDFWEYDPTTNTWIQKADFGGSARDKAVSFSIGNKGYIGTGGYISSNEIKSFYKDFWQYDPVSDIWVQKADFGGEGRSGAVSFTINNSGYCGSGLPFENTDFWKYDVVENAWLKKANFGGSTRLGAVGFSIGNKGYIGGGASTGGEKKDFWEFDPILNTWTQKADIGGFERQHAVGFSIGDKGYLGTGYASEFPETYLNDFWEYDPLSNIWEQKTDFEGGARAWAIGFNIGSKGYIGNGNDGDSNLRDFWQYDPQLDIWTQMADFEGAVRNNAVGFSIENKGYIGIGKNNLDYNLKDFWEYDPVLNDWIKKSDFGGAGRSSAVSFSIGNKGYVGTGVVSGTGSTKDFWEYDPILDTWTQKEDFGGTSRYDAAGFSIGNKGYIGTGDDDIVVLGYTKDFWEYTPDIACLPPGNLKTKDITATTAKLKWTNNEAATSNKLRYKLSGSGSWILLGPNGQSKTIEELLPATEYVWQIKSVCGTAPKITSEWSEKQFFTTAPLRLFASDDNFSVKAYPNPSSQSILISFFLDQASQTMIELLDLSGKSLVVVEAGNLSAGYHEIFVERNLLKEGIYFIRLKINEEVVIKKIIFN